MDKWDTIGSRVVRASVMDVFIKRFDLWIVRSGEVRCSYIHTVHSSFFMTDNVTQDRHYLLMLSKILMKIEIRILTHSSFFYPTN